MAKTLQDVINNFLDNIDRFDDMQLEAIAHLIEVELQERDYMRNPQNFPGDDIDN